MGRFDFVSPGAAFTGEITKLLAERKVEERQRLLDSLATNADQRAATEATEQKKVRDAQLKSQQQQDEIARLGAITGNMDVGDAPTGMAQEDVDLGKKYHAWKDVPVPRTSAAVTNMQGEEGGPPAEGFTPEQNQQGPAPTRLGYVGTAAQRDRDRKKQQSAQMIANLLQDADPAKKEAGALMQRVWEARDGDIPDGMFDMLAPNHLQIFDERNGKLGKAQDIPFGTKIMTRGYPPSGAYRPYEPAKPIGRTPEGVPVMQDQKDGHLYIDPSGIQTGTDTTDAPLSVSPVLSDKHTVSVRRLEPNNGYFGDGVTVDAADMRVFRKTASDIISAAKTTKTVKHLATMLISDIDDYNLALTTTPLDEREASQLEQLSNMLVPAGIDVIIQNNPVKKSKPPAAKPKTPMETTLSNRTRGY